MKKSIKIFKDERYYLLGSDKNNIKYWLREPSWDCDWYWSCGWVETFKDGDIDTHHLLDMYDDMCVWFPGIIGSKKIIINSPFTEDEQWKLAELFKTMYIIKNYANLMYTGYSGISYIYELNLKDLDYAKEINEKLLPQIFDTIKNIMEPENEKETKKDI